MSDTGTARELAVLKAAFAAVIYHLSPDQCRLISSDLDGLKTTLEQQIQAWMYAPGDDDKKRQEIEEAAALRGLREIQDQLQVQAAR